MLYRKAARGPRAPEATPGQGMTENAEAPGEVLGEIRVGEGIGAATIAGANLRRAREKIVNPVGIAREHRSPKPTKPTEPIEPTKANDLSKAIDPTKAIERTKAIDPTKVIERTDPIERTKRCPPPERPSDR